MLFYILSTRRNTQVRLKGSVLKTDRRVTPRGGSNPSSSSINFNFNIVAHKTGDKIRPKQLGGFFLCICLMHKKKHILDYPICAFVIFKMSFNRSSTSRHTLIASSGLLTTSVLSMSIIKTSLAL
jgi:hypothetical protein